MASTLDYLGSLAPHPRHGETHRHTHQCIGTVGARVSGMRGAMHRRTRTCKAVAARVSNRTVSGNRSQPQWQTTCGGSNHLLPPQHPPALAANLWERAAKAARLVRATERHRVRHTGPPASGSGTWADGARAGQAPAPGHPQHNLRPWSSRPGHGCKRQRKARHAGLEGVHADGASPVGRPTGRRSELGVGTRVRFAARLPNAPRALRIT